MSTRLARRPLARIPFFSTVDPSTAFENRLQKFYDDLFTPAQTFGMMPAVEIAESPTDYTAILELPGLTQKDVEVAFEDDCLTIKGEKRDERETKGNDKKYHLVERSYGSFRRSFTFPANVEEGEISATMKDGVLTVRLPKTADETARNRKINIDVK